MASGAQIDYDALAKQSGATSSQPGGASSQPDYDALARQAGATSSTPTPQQPGPTISARPSGGMFQNAANWFEDLGADIRDSGTRTAPGRILHSMGAPGTDAGVPHKVGEFMASPQLGLTRMAQGASEIPAGKVSKGVADVTGGAIQAAQIPGAFAMAANPAAAVRPLVTGTVAQHTGRRIAAAMGASQDTQEAVGNVAGIAGGVAGETVLPKATAAVAGKVSNIRNGIVDDPHATLVQALKPRATAVNFDQSMQRALPDLKSAETQLGKPIAGVEDAIEAVRLAKTANRDQFRGFTGPAAARGQMVNLTPVADAMDASIPQKFRFENTNSDGTPNTALRARLDASARYRGAQVPIEHAEQLLQDTNAELDAFYAKYPAAQRKALRANPETAHTVAQGDALRDAIYSTLDDASQGAGPRELQMRYGALMDAEDALMRRKNVAARQQPESLQQQISKVRAAGKVALGAGKIFTGRPASGAADILEATAMRQAADWLKEQQATDNLIARALRSYKDGPNPPVEPPLPPNIKGLLPAAPLVTPPPADTSFVRGVPAMPHPPNPQRALPPATTRFAGPVPDPSGVTAVSASPPFRVDFSQRALPPASPQPLNQELGSSSGDIVGQPQPSKFQMPAAGTMAKRMGMAVRQKLDQNTQSSDILPADAGTVQGPAIRTESGAGARPTTGSAIAGNATTIAVPGENTAYPGRYALRELSELNPSHGGITFERNPNFPYENDRDYSNPVNQERVILNSSPDRFNPNYLINTNPDAGNGPPIIEPDGHVLGGNNRTMILHRVSRQNPTGWQAYRDALSQQASQFGLEPSAVHAMREPVLVREMDPLNTGQQGNAGQQRAITDFNKTGTAQLTAAERATADARGLHPDVAAYIGSAIEGEGDGATLKDALSGPAGIGIINHLVDSGVFTMQEKPNLIDSRTGAVTAAAKERISKMLTGALFRDSDQMARMAPEVRNKLERIAAPVLQSQAKPGWDLLPAVRDAVDLIEYANTHDIKSLSDVVNQQGMFGNEPQFSPEAVTLANVIRRLTPTEIGKRFKRYMGDSVPTMLGESSPEQAFAEHFQTADPVPAGKKMPPPR